MQIEITSTPINDWDKHAQHPLQTTMYAMYNYEHNGCIPHYCYIKKNGRTEGQLLYFVKGKGAEFFTCFPLGKTIGKISKRFFPVISFKQGPTYYEEYNRAYTIEDIIEELKQFHQIKNVQADLPFKINNNTWATYIINLNKTKEELLKNINKNARYEIRKNINKVEIFIANDKEHLQIYKNILSNKRKEQGINYLPPAYPNYIMFKYFKDNCQVFFVKYKNEIIAASGILAFGDYIIDTGIGVGKHPEVNIGEVLKWEIMKWGKEKGFKYYDLMGVVPKEQGNTKEKAIRFFKSKFGGEYKEYSIIR